jgi:hypothetical protein
MRGKRDYIAIVVLVDEMLFTIIAQVSQLQHEHKYDTNSCQNNSTKQKSKFAQQLDSFATQVICILCG